MYKDFKWLKILSRYCKHHDCADCEINKLLEYPFRECISQIEKHFYEVCNILLKFNEEHPVQTNKDMFLKIFPNASEVGELSPCVFDKDWEKKYCYDHTDCTDCRQKFWNSEYVEVKDE